MDVGDSMRSSFVFDHPYQGPIQVHYNPPDGEFNIWMYAMIGVGSAFIIFVIASIYLMCKSPAGGDHTPLRRHPTKTTRDRTPLPSKDHL
ncbi:Thrombospondin type-1 domain-containing protein 7B [Orchesella cincta]|uniref:Thrombospondin type-1 domain-containing protein 7B n=1 Tax=Orchesella cincta TaxID=48709 RepID=A0A1D2MI49_ORCCI|nr:Thrombospondin type-1 domain-containing protein 7B [Orchesella cincta]